MRTLQLFITGVTSVSLGACAWLYGDQQTTTSEQPASQAQQAQDAPPIAASARLVRNVQQQLQAEGIDPGTVDGVWGPQTQQAVREFQQAQGLEPSGQLDTRTLSALGITGEQSASAGAGALQQRSEPPSLRNLDANNDQKLSRQEYGASGQAQRGQSQQALGQMQVSKLIGAKVNGSQAEELGEINDVVIDLQGGKVHAAVLEFGGVLGLGEKHYAFPISQLKHGKGDNFTLNVDKDKLENAEGFAQGQWPAMNDEYWGRVGGQASAGASKSQGGKQKMDLVRASEMIGKEVQDKSGNEVGEIKDIAVDLKTGQLRNVVIDVNDAGETQVQAKALTRGTGDKIVLNMSAQQLKGRSSTGATRDRESSGSARK